ncbi:hypothetical protein GQX74_001312 [Glossina fuscipes]|nr:hypothetical protein GQX74_001312 [Glossina fuscipes]
MDTGSSDLLLHQQALLAKFISCANEGEARLSVSFPFAIRIFPNTNDLLFTSGLMMKEFSSNFCSCLRFMDVALRNSLLCWPKNSFELWPANIIAVRTGLLLTGFLLLAGLMYMGIISGVDPNIGTRPYFKNMIIIIEILFNGKIYWKR